MWTENLNLLSQADKISNDWNDSEGYFFRPKSDGSYSNNTMIIRVKKAKCALRAKITFSQESSWRGKDQPSTQNKKTKK
jgi:hypothetical protein